MCYSPAFTIRHNCLALCCYSEKSNDFESQIELLKAKKSELTKELCDREVVIKRRKVLLIQPVLHIKFVMQVSLKPSFFNWTRIS